VEEELMKKLIVSILLLVIVSSMSLYSAQIVDTVVNPLPAESQKWGVGLIMSSPFAIGIMGEYDFGAAVASVALGFDNLYGTGAFMFRMAGQYDFAAPFDNGTFSVYPSAGGHIDLLAGSIFGFRFGGHIALSSYFFRELPLKLYIEVGPSITASAFTTVFDITASMGAVYKL
jgi:hypothetical protein